jgi:F-type H+-transporting ATPase subunit b
MIAFSLSTFLVTVLNIGILFVILRAVLFKPVTRFMDERSKKIQDAVEQAEKDRNRAKALLAQYEAHLKNADAEADAIIRAARENAGQEAEKIIARGRALAEAILANAHKQLVLEHEAAMGVFRREAAELVVAASGRLLGREIQAGDSGHYADMLLDEIGKS